jgi:hypothetical protein
MEKARADGPARYQIRKVVHRNKSGVFLGSDVYPPLGLRVARFGFRRVDRANGRVGWRHAVLYELEPPAQRLLMWLEELGEVKPLTFMAAYKLARLADPTTGVIRGTQVHLAGLAGIHPRTLRAILRALRQDGHIRTHRGAFNTYTLIMKRAGGDGSASSDPPADDDRATSDNSADIGWTCCCSPRTSNCRREKTENDSTLFSASAKTAVVRPRLLPKNSPKSGASNQIST